MNVNIVGLCDCVKISLSVESDRSALYQTEGGVRLFALNMQPGVVLVNRLISFYIYHDMPTFESGISKIYLISLLMLLIAYMIVLMMENSVRIYILIYKKHLTW